MKTIKDVSIQNTMAFHQLSLDDQRAFGDWCPRLSQSKFFEFNDEIYCLDDGGTHDDPALNGWEHIYHLDDQEAIIVNLLGNGQIKIGLYS